MASTTSVEANDTVVNAKKALRKSVRDALEAFPEARIAEESKIITSRLLSSSAYQQARAVSVFLSMPKEVQTRSLLQSIFTDKKRCFVPRMIDKTKMVMLEAYSLDDIDSFPKDRWGIAEPPLNQSRSEAADCPELDLILMPGCAFDRANRRIGYGRGYYDRYLNSLAAERGSAMPKLIGLALSPQMVPQVPTTEFDYVLDSVVNAIDQ